ncbi:hypothetical protein BGZ68_008492 [Mortierella alpina]|nr:hypothetical protein BGZ68_008492 [Mortierella alpina]
MDIMVYKPCRSETKSRDGTEGDISQARVPFPLQALLDAKPKIIKRDGLHSDAKFDDNGWPIVVMDDGSPKYFNKHTSDYLDEMSGCEAHN